MCILLRQELPTVSEMPFAEGCALGSDAHVRDVA
jgi:hypothetical protein